MRNPFDELIPKSEPQDYGYEPVGGAMSCQYYPCEEVATDGKYYWEERILLYTCPAGHENKSEGVSL